MQGEELPEALVREAADKIMRAAGSGLSYYMPGSQRRIMAEVKAAMLAALQSQEPGQ